MLIRGEGNKGRERVEREYVYKSNNKYTRPWRKTKLLKYL